MTPMASHRRGNLRAARGRWAAIVLAMLLSIAAVVGLLQAQARLGVAMQGNYLATRPAHAQLMGVELDAATLAALRAMDGVEAARAGASASTRVRAADGRWRPALLFALPAAGEAALASPRLATGRWPGAGEVLIERDDVKLLGTVAAVELEGAGRFTITGSGHDAALAPASTEGIVYLYIDAATLAAFKPRHFALLRFEGVEASRDQARADRLARGVVTWLAARGQAVQELRSPPLAEHPHQRQAEGAVQMLLACALASTLLCAVTAAALLRGWLDAQARQIGVLKSLGAGRGLLLASYGRLVGLLIGGAALAGAGLGVLAGEGLARVSAELLNLDLGGLQIVPSAVAWGLSLGLALPLAFIAWPLWRLMAQPARAAMRDGAISRPDALERLAIPGPLAWPLALRLAVRSLLRRRRRLALSVLLLGAAGAIFMGSLNLRAGWNDLVEQGAAGRRYQVELRLAAPATAASLSALWTASPEVAEAEPWAAQRAVWLQGDGIALSRTYPDGGHGALGLRHVPPGARLLAPKRVEGRWLDEHAAEDDWVINRSAAHLLDAPPRLGQILTVVSDGQRLSGRLVGVIDEAMSPANVYLPATPGAASVQWRLRLREGVDPDGVAQALTERAARLGVGVVRSSTEADLRRSAAGHLRVLVRALNWVALSTAVVGLVALASALGSGVAERRRELATLRALGASTRLLQTSVVLEGLAAVALSLGLAFAFGALVDPALAARLGAVTGQPLRAGFSPLGALAWVLLAGAGALLASALPVRRMGRVRREAF